MRARETGGAALPNWYLHPLVAEQKRHVHLELVHAVAGQAGLAGVGHFGPRQEFLEALAGLARVLRPGGRIVLTLDNPANPLYPLLRGITRRGWAPYSLGYTPSLTQVERDLNRLGLNVLHRDWLIHNPRLLSTLLFGVLPWHGAVSWLLKQFARLSALPTRGWTACFHAVCAEKPEDGIARMVSRRSHT